MNYKELAKLERQFDKLSDEEKIRRLQVVSQYYLSLLTNGAKVVVDVTKHWSQFEMLEEDGNVC